MAIYDYHVRLVCEAASPWEYYRTVQTDETDDTIECPAHPGGSTRDFVIEHIVENVPTCEGNTPSDLTIRTNVGSAIVNDDYVVTADPTDKKFIKICILRDNLSTDLEIYAFEKTTGEYGNIPSGKSLEKDLKEFSVVAAGTVLVEEQDWI